MSLSFDDLVEEKTLLQKDFVELEKQVKNVEVELLQMRANLNALNGAIQQVNKMMARARGNSTQTSRVKKK
mgnify:FL=1